MRRKLTRFPGASSDRSDGSLALDACCFFFLDAVLDFGGSATCLYRPPSAVRVAHAQMK